MKVLVSIQQPVVAWQIPPECVDRLRRSFPAITFVHATDDASRARGLADCDVAYTWILSAAELAAAPRLRWVHTSAVAVETLCLPEFFARDVIISNSRGVQSTPIAEHVFAVLLALAKQIPFVIENQRQRRWAQNDFRGDRMPWLLNGRTLGLIGAGTIGSQIARLASAFGMHVLALTRREKTGAVAGVHEMLPPGNLDALLERSDALVIAAPLTPETVNMIAAPQLARMKRGSVVINVGRHECQAAYRVATSELPEPGGAQMNGIRHRGAAIAAALAIAASGVAWTGCGGDDNSDEATDAINQATDAVNEALDQSDEQIEKAQEQAEEIQNQAEEAVDEAQKDLPENAQEAVDKAQKKAEKATEDAQDQADQALDQAQQESGGY